MRTDEELKQIAIDIVDEKIFTDRHLKDGNSISGTFMPILLGAFAEFTEEQIKDLGLIFEYLDKAGPMAVNGMPTFFSLQYLTKAELEITSKHFEEYKNLKKSFMGS